MYDVEDYGRMFADGVRMDAYVSAMRAVIRPGSVVVDVGAGTGIMTLWACKLGARRVYAIEPNPAIAVARTICRDNGVADRVTFFEAPTSEVELPERADVLMSDVRGRLPVTAANFDAVNDARARFLAVGGAMLPLRDDLFVALVEARALADEIVTPWASSDFDLGAGRAHVLSGVHSDLHTDATVLRPDDLVSDGARWASLDYGAELPPLVTGRVSLTAQRDATAHALAYWFETTLAPGIGFTTAPGNPRVYGRMVTFLAEPLVLRRGDVTAVEIFARRAEEGFLWGWTAQTTRADGGKGPTTRQTTFARSFHPPVEVDARRLRLAREGRLAHEVLGQLAERALSVSEIAAWARTRGAELGVSRDAAAGVIRRIVEHFSAPER